MITDAGAGRLIDAERSLRAALDDPAAAQRALLTAILRESADTEIGRRYAFSTISSAHEYAARVPVHRYEDLEPEVAKMLRGDRDVLFAGTPIFFARTSGTTAAPKHIPYSAGVLDEYWLFGAPIWGAIQRVHPGVLDPGMSIFGQYQEDTSPAGVVIGSASGFVKRTNCTGFGDFDVLPSAVTEEARHDVRYYAILLIGLSSSLRMLHAVNPSTILTLFRQAEAFADRLAVDLERGECVAAPEGVRELLARAGFQLQPRPETARALREMTGGFEPLRVWPELRMLVTWQGGNTRHYLEQLAPLCPGCILRATCSGSSEAALLVPLEDSWTGGVPALLSTVVEYLPVDAEPVTGAFVPVTELAVGRSYRMCVTNRRGMYRLLMDDAFYVEGHAGLTPVLQFSNRLATSSLTGEKLTEAQVLDAVERARQASGLELVEFQVAPEWGAPPRYVVMIEQREAEPRAEALRRFASAFEAALRSCNVEYDAKRTSGRLAPPVLRLLRAGELARQLRRSLARSDAQAKIPRLQIKMVGELSIEHLTEMEAS